MRASDLATAILAVGVLAFGACSKERGHDLIDDTLPPGDFFPRQEEPRGNSDADALVRDAAAARSDALIVLVGGRVVVERYFARDPGPVDLRSDTKSVVAILVGTLLDDKKIADIDAPLSTWFTEWSIGPKAAVTLRHVLTQTTGLEHQPFSGHLMRQPDQLAYVRASAIVDEPGRAFSYSNEATNLLAGIVQAAAGEPLDRYAARRLFAPLGITHFSWEKDRAGNCLAYTGLSLSARDAARIGQLMLNGGSHEGHPIVSSDWVRQMTSVGTPANDRYGLLWWLRYKGDKRPIGYYADGWLGQYISVYPEARVVAVRLRKQTGAGDETENATYGFHAFQADVERAFAIR